MIKSNKLISKINRPKPDSLERKNLYRFEKNERTTLFSNDVFNEIIDSINPFDLVAYGELEPFYYSLIKYLKIKRNQILLTSGADQGIKLLFETFLQKEDEVINYSPNYAMYSVYTKMYGGNEITKYFNDNLSIDIDDLINSVNSKTKFIIISNPGHNGVIISKEKIISLLNATSKSKTLVLIDEAYVDFTNVSMKDHILSFANLVIVRTMSKGFGLASIRIGYIIACKELIDEVYRVKPVHEISGLAAKIGKYLIENINIKDDYVEQVKIGKEVLIKNFEKMNIHFLPTDSNFIYFKINENIDQNSVYNELLKKDIYIRSKNKIYPFFDYLRVTIGDKAQMEFFCSELKKILIK